MDKRYTSLKEFYPYYLTEHSNRTSRILHFIGTSLFISVLIYCAVTRTWNWFIAGPLIAYAFAWVGHFFFEKNKPATFKYPFYSLASDFIMLFHFLTGQLPNRRKAADAVHKASV